MSKHIREHGSAKFNLKRDRVFSEIFVFQDEQILEPLLKFCEAKPDNPENSNFEQLIANLRVVRLNSPLDSLTFSAAALEDVGALIDTFGAISGGRLFSQPSNEDSSCLSTWFDFYQPSNLAEWVVSQFETRVLRYFLKKDCQSLFSRVPDSLVTAFASFWADATSGQKQELIDDTAGRIAEYKEACFAFTSTSFHGVKGEGQATLNTSREKLSRTERMFKFVINSKGPVRTTRELTKAEVASLLKTASEEELSKFISFVASFKLEEAYSARAFYMSSLVDSYDRQLLAAKAAAAKERQQAKSQAAKNHSNLSSKQANLENDQEPQESHHSTFVTGSERTSYNSDVSDASSPQPERFFDCRSQNTPLTCSSSRQILSQNIVQNVVDGLLDMVVCDRPVFKSRVWSARKLLNWTQKLGANYKMILAAEFFELLSKCSRKFNWEAKDKAKLERITTENERFDTGDSDFGFRAQDAFLNRTGRLSERVNVFEGKETFLVSKGAKGSEPTPRDEAEQGSLTRESDSCNADTDPLFQRRSPNNNKLIELNNLGRNHKHQQNKNRQRTPQIDREQRVSTDLNKTGFDRRTRSPDHRRQDQSSQNLKKHRQFGYVDTPSKQQEPAELNSAQEQISKVSESVGGIRQNNQIQGFGDAKEDKRKKKPKQPKLRKLKNEAKNASKETATLTVNFSRQVAPSGNDLQTLTVKSNIEESFKGQRMTREVVVTEKRTANTTEVIAQATTTITSTPTVPLKSQRQETASVKAVAYKWDSKVETQEESLFDRRSAKPKDQPAVKVLEPKGSKFKSKAKPNDNATKPSPKELESQTKSQAAESVKVKKQPKTTERKLERKQPVKNETSRPPIISRRWDDEPVEELNLHRLTLDFNKHQTNMQNQRFYSLCEKTSVRGFKNETEQQNDKTDPKANVFECPNEMMEADRRTADATSSKTMPEAPPRRSLKVNKLSRLSSKFSSEFRPVNTENSFSYGFNFSSYYAPSFQNDPAILGFPGMVSEAGQKMNMKEHSVSAIEDSPFESAKLRVERVRNALISADLTSLQQKLAALNQTVQTSRADVIAKLSEIVKLSFNNPEISLVPYGSYETGLLTPFSDVDLAIQGCQTIDKSEAIRVLELLDYNLKLSDFVIKTTLILTSTVPLLKIDCMGECKDSNGTHQTIVKVDIIVNLNEDGGIENSALRTTAYIHKSISAFRSFFTNVLVLKLILNYSGLSNSYTGEFIRRSQFLRSFAAVQRVCGDELAGEMRGHGEDFRRIFGVHYARVR